MLSLRPAGVDVRAQRGRVWAPHLSARHGAVREPPALPSAGPRKHHPPTHGCCHGAVWPRKRCPRRHHGGVAAEEPAAVSHGVAHPVQALKGAGFDGVGGDLALEILSYERANV